MYAGWALAAMLATLAAACGGGGDETGDSGQIFPFISTQPSDISVAEGSAATFSVTATALPLPSYQWSSSADGIAFNTISSATSESFTIASASSAQNGVRYRVVVSNGAGSVTSNAARLTVIATVVAPAITVQPADQTVTAPATATFNVTATGTTPSYEWQLSTDAGVTFAPIVGAVNAPALAVTNTGTMQSGYRYRVRVVNSAGEVTSTAAILTVNP